MTARTIVAVQEAMILASWASLEDGEDGDPLQAAKYGTRTMQVTGDFGAGGTVIAEGCNELTPVNWFPLTIDGTTPVEFTAAGGQMLWENPYHIRPAVSAGTGVDVAVTILAAM